MISKARVALAGALIPKQDFVFSFRLGHRSKKIGVKVLDPGV